MAKTKKKNTDKKMLGWVFIAKGIGIILVVIGHFTPANVSPDYWLFMKKSIYTFHMPLFFILSGYLFNVERYNLIDLVKKKSHRLLLPFVTVAIISFFIKYLASFWVELDNPITLNTVTALLYDPSMSYMPLLWFLHSLFILFISYKIIHSCLPNNYVILFLLLLFNLFYPVIEIPFWGKVFVNFPYFLIGVLLKEKALLCPRGVLNNAVWGVLSLFLFIFGDVSLLTHDVNWFYKDATRIITAISGALFVIFLSKIICEKWNNSGVFKVLYIAGFYSMSIYLFHTIFESSVRIYMYQLHNPTAGSFLLVAICSIVPGIVLPIIMEKNVFRTFAVTRKYILGLG